jgi:hypothetical protein
MCTRRLHYGRKFFDVHAASGSPLAKETLRRTAQLVRRWAASLWPCNGRPARVARTASPACLSSQVCMTAGSDIAKAIEHAFTRRPALQHYASSGSLPIGKNTVENVVRAIAIGQKNSLFACAEPASYRGGAIQSLFATAELNELNPAYWLAATLTKLLTCLQQAGRFAATVRKLYTALNFDGRWDGWPLTDQTFETWSYEREGLQLDDLAALSRASPHVLRHTSAH